MSSETGPVSGGNEVEKQPADVDEQNPAMADITSILEACAASLTVSDPLICDEKSFSLHDSMSALEIKDPKMDCCEISASAMPLSTPDSSSGDAMVPPRPLPTGLDDTVYPLPWKELTVCDAAVVALEGLTRLEALFSGASVAESIYTCLYAHNAVLLDMRKRLQGKNDGVSLAEKFEALVQVSSKKDSLGSLAQIAVYASTLAMVEISETFRSIVLHADIYEEEDFSTNSYGLKYVSGEDAKEVIDTILYAIQRLKEADEPGNEDVRILQLVLHFHLELLTTCRSMASLVPEDTRRAAQKSKTLVQSAIHQLAELQTIVTARMENSSSMESVLKCSFDPFVYRPLVGNAPIRKVSFRNPVDSIQKFLTVMSEVDWVCCDLLLKADNLGRLRRMLMRISTSSVNILSRSIIVLTLYFGEKLLGQHDLVYLVKEDIKQATKIPEAVLESAYGKELVNRLAKPIYDTLKLFALNRNRQQGYMNIIMFPDWAALQQEAHSVDLAVASAAPVTQFSFFSHYVLSNIVMLMDHSVALSIELSLVQNHHDLAEAYWYRDFLLSSLMNTVATMRRVRAEAQQRAPNGGKRKAGTVKKKKGDASASLEDALEDFDFSLLTLKRNLCRGIARYIAALNQAELLQPVSYEFTSHELRFQRRYEAFAHIATPPPLTYDDFRQGSDHSSVSQKDLLSSTLECFQTSKALVDGLIARLPSLEHSYLPVCEEELRSLAKVCVGNAVYIMRLSQMISGRHKASGSVSFDLETNKQFCIIKMA